MIIKTLTNKQLEQLEEPAMKDPKHISNFRLIDHYEKGKGTFVYRVVCEFYPDDAKGQLNEKESK